MKRSPNCFKRLRMQVKLQNVIQLFTTVCQECVNCFHSFGLALQLSSGDRQTAAPRISTGLVRKLLASEAVRKKYIPQYIQFSSQAV